MKWRCEDCFGRPVFCSSCLRDTHHLQPFHRVSRWDGQCFSRSTLEKAGVTLNLGHAGTLCPKYRPLTSKETEVPFAGGTCPAILEETRNASSARQSPLSPGESTSDLGLNLLAFNSPISGGVQLCTTVESVAGTDEEQLPPLDGEIPPQPSPAAAPAPAPAASRHAPPAPETVLDWQSYLSPTGSPAPELQIDPLDPLEKQKHLNSFLGDESEDEDSWRNTDTGGIPLRNRLPKRTDDKYDCPILTVVDITGIHELRTRFCRCSSLEDNPLSHQLLSMGLFPSSMKKTRTVFTFRLLEDFHISNMEGKVSAFKYYGKLRRLTSNAFPSMVTDRYRELLRALRQWRDIRSRQRAGVPFEPEGSEVPLGGLGLFCAACPQPDVNLPKNWETDPNR